MQQNFMWGSGQPATSLSEIRQLFLGHGVELLLHKPLSPNDNSKNQFYLGSGFGMLNELPIAEVEERLHKNAENSTFVAPIDLSWVGPDGVLEKAPHAKLIFYPKYPEVRLSGVIQGCKSAPRSLLTTRLEGRHLFLGVVKERAIIAMVVVGLDDLQSQVQESSPRSLHKGTPLRTIPLSSSSYDPHSKHHIVERLRSVAAKGWISSCRLNANLDVLPCDSPNCGGYTLEAQFGISPNGSADPDYSGWELKQYSHGKSERSSHAVTIMTPEPTKGLYSTHGAEAFVRTYGYADKRGRVDRLNFGGIHLVGECHHLTGLTLTLEGFDLTSGKIIDAGGGIGLRDTEGTLAAMWPYAKLMKHWNNKHANCAYVPSRMRTTPSRAYRFGPFADLGQRTSFERLLQAFGRGVVYYDPGLKLENASGRKPKLKKRNQFRIKKRDVSVLYEIFARYDLKSGQEVPLS